MVACWPGAPRDHCAGSWPGQLGQWGQLSVPARLNSYRDPQGETSHPRASILSWHRPSCLPGCALELSHDWYQQGSRCLGEMALSPLASHSLKPTTASARCSAFEALLPPCLGFDLSPPLGSLPFSETSSPHSQSLNLYISSA